MCQLSLGSKLWLGLGLHWLRLIRTSSPAVSNELYVTRLKQKNVTTMYVSPCFFFVCNV